MTRWALNTPALKCLTMKTIRKKRAISQIIEQEEEQIVEVLKPEEEHVPTEEVIRASDR